MGMEMSGVLDTLIQNYDLSDIINQAIILILLLLLFAQSNVRFRWKRKSTYY